MKTDDLFASGFAIPSPSSSGPSGPPATPLCPGDLPLVLLPVRLETRFFPQAGGAMELRVRVYPDKIHLDSHEPELTADEITWGQHHVTQDWRAGRDTAARADAWRQLADRFGAPRAAWIALLLAPTNAAQRPDEPTPAGGELAVPPVFPAITPASGDAAWRHAPEAKLLPDRWIAVLHSAGQVALTVTSQDIAHPLQVGPAPNLPEPTGAEDAAIRAGERLAIDPGMDWMVDFDKAEAAGMGLRLPVSAALLAAGLDSLVVFGVLRRESADQTATHLADLLDAHHHTDGLAFMRPGTPTNNTDDRRTDYGSRDPGQLRSYALQAADVQAPGATNALRVGTALGLPADRIVPTFGRVERGLACDDDDARGMNTALWQVGWGYFLSNMVGAEGGLGAADLDWARTHWREHVRAFGPLPALRCGTQPYGLLPVTSLDLWQPLPGEAADPRDAWLKGLLGKLREKVWRPALASVTRIGSRQSPPDPDADLADLMRGDGVSGGYQVRAVFGRHFLQHLQRLAGGSLPDSDPAQTRLLDALSFLARPRLAHLWNHDGTSPVGAPLVQRGEVSPWAPLAPDYLGELLGQREIAALIAMRPDAANSDGTPLLKLLLRHALLREIAAAAARLLATDQNLLLPLLRDAELVDLVDGAAPTHHWLWQLEQPLPANPSVTLREHLQTVTDFSPDALAALGQFRTALAHLQGLDSEALSLAMQGTLDLSAHRLDAWVTSLATKRLAAMRDGGQSGGPAGQYIGAYGWVENLRPIPANQAAPVATLPPGEPGPLQAAANDSGFIHAPSLTQAATAALLRNAHLGPGGVPGATDPFAIDLSSRRVREAQHLLDGLRQGQPLGALLGYRFERALHDTVVDNGLRLDRFIAPLRALAPLVARDHPDSDAPQESVAADNVVDGLVLSRRWAEERVAVDAVLTAHAPPPTSGEHAALVRLLDQLAGAIDGLGDALSAESAHQLVRGNTTRLAGTLAAIAQGDAPPPELEVVRTPRSGTGLTHRLMLLMSGTTNLATPGWLPADSGTRSAADKLLNFWAAKLLGDAGKVRCTIERLQADGSVAETRSLLLSEVGVGPLDAVYGVDAEAGSGAGSTDGLSELEQQVLYFARRKPGGFDPLATLRFRHERPGDLAAGEITLFDLIEQARAMRRLLAVARGASPDDLATPDRAAQGSIDLVDLEARAVRAENLLNAAHKGLQALLAKPATLTGELLRSALMKLGAFGLGPAIPVSVAGEDATAVAALVAQAQALLKASGVRMDQFLALRAQPVATEPRARRDQLVARLKAVFGPSFVVLPRFSVDAVAAGELASALAASTQAQGGDPLAANTWFARSARVREPVSRLGECLQRAEVLGAPARLNLAVAQLPFSGVERWVGLPALPGTELPHSRLSLVVHSVAAVAPAQVLSGLLVDEWVEIVPATHETTGVAFQFDVPDAQAPQNVLIAVPPVPGQDWTAESLRHLLMETLDLAKLRAVDGASLGAAAQHLPGLYLAFNPADHAVSTDVAPLTA